MLLRIRLSQMTHYYFTCWSLLIHCFWSTGFPGGSVVENPPASAGDVGLIHGSRRSPGGGGQPTQYSCPRIPCTEEPGRLSRVRLFATPWTVAHQALQSMEFSRQEYWSGLPFPSAGDLPNPGITPGSPAPQADALTAEPPGSASVWWLHMETAMSHWCGIIGRGPGHLSELPG